MASTCCHTIWFRCAIFRHPTDRPTGGSLIKIFFSYRPAKLKSEIQRKLGEQEFSNRTANGSAYTTTTITTTRNDVLGAKMRTINHLARFGGSSSSSDPRRSLLACCSLSGVSRHHHHSISRQFLHNFNSKKHGKACFVDSGVLFWGIHASCSFPS